MRTLATDTGLRFAPDERRRFVPDAAAFRRDACVFVPDRRVHRKATYKIMAGKTERGLLLDHKRLHKDLYNAALDERVNAWRKAKKSVSFAEQCKALTQIRAELSEYAALNAQSCQVTLKRVDRAFQNFFCRVKTGAKAPGFPRFKSLDRFPGWGYKSHKDGFEFAPGPNWRNGKVRLAGIGWLPVRGEARTPGEVVAAEVVQKAGDWYLSVTLLCEPHREVAEERTSAALDWGTEWFLAVCEEDREGRFHAGDVLAAEVTLIANPRFERKMRERIEAAQQTLSRKVRGSQAWRAAKRRLGKLLAKLANCRKDFRDKVCAELVFQHHTLVTEGLEVKGMTASARGTVEEPGVNVAQKAGLNRSILDGSPGAFFSRLATVAEEARSLYVELDVRSEAPSQHCPKCGSRKRKEMSEREHVCEVCGHREQRDGASARYMLGRYYGHVPRPARIGPGATGRVAKSSSRREPKRETPARAAQAWLV